MTYVTFPAIAYRDITLPVPLDWANPDGESLTLFAREVVDPKRKDEDLPLLLFLQGGPGGKGPRPSGGGPVWLKTALETFRVILLDQRGTGRSSAVEGRHMQRFASAEEGARFLASFRADSIIRDCEHMRKSLYEGRKWSTLGQSYGGFLTLSYLSMAPQALEACYVTGGLSGLDASAEDVYERTFPRVAEKNRHFYARFAADKAQLARIADILASEDIRLPNGDRLTVRRLQTLGIAFGMKPGYEEVHWLLDGALDQDGKLSESFLHDVMVETGYATNPLYCALQEVIYAQNGAVTNWAAQREREKHPVFAEGHRPLLFTGEMMFPWMFEDIKALRPFRAATEALHQRPIEAALYDKVRLAANEVPVAAAVYFDDMYVDAGLSLETAGRVGNLKSWVTNEYEHDGLRQDSRVLKRLIAMVAGTE
ncbi:alpha/beta fold hydrolase [uncultured Cohaesibacter sp.]|uniref:alpha/beta fold hydrolase n=1 Tax=uncultured Cohaesibacter sp. TaxID=1002546 RepID=UPI0029C685F0|nr:alpha/beta fold hydrolase [uncultured Cohaesibacter sp.]